MATDPPIGVPRVYPGETIPHLYPGEKATAQFDPADVARVLAAGGGPVAVTGWLVEPAPGWRMALKRWRWRWFGWVDRRLGGRAKLSADLTVQERPRDDDE